MARGDAFNSIDALTHCNQSSRSRLEGAANVISVTRDDAPIVALSRNNFSKNGVGARFRSLRSKTSSATTFTEGDNGTSNRNSRAVRDL